MPDPEFPISLVTILAIAGGLLLAILLLLVRISWRLSRIEKNAAGSSRSSSRETADQPPSVAETSPGGAFEAFLAEDPDRRELTKSEQFSAYRRWRQDKGMNWSNS